MDLGFTMDQEQNKDNPGNEAGGGDLRDLPAEDGPFRSSVPTNQHYLVQLRLRCLRGRLRASLPQEMHHGLGKYQKKLSDRQLSHRTLIVYTIILQYSCVITIIYSKNKEQK